MAECLASCHWQQHVYNVQTFCVQFDDVYRYIRIRNKNLKYIHDENGIVEVCVSAMVRTFESKHVLCSCIQCMFQ